MKTQKTLVIGILVMFVLPLMAEVQTGYVRTIGRNGKPGQPISGVMVRAEGPANMVMSDAQGQFTLTLHEATRDDAYRLASVKKSNYELLDKDVIGREYGFTTVPMEIVLVNLTEMQAEKAAMAERFERQYAETYQKKMAELQAQYEAKQITGEEYASREEELTQALETMLAQIETLVDRYVRTDYDRLDSLDQVINAHIEMGEFDEAERLIRSKGSIQERLADLQEGKEAQRQIEEAQRKIEAANSKKQESLKRDLSLLIDIADAHLRPDSAYFYRKQLAEVDPEDVRNLGVLMRYACMFEEYELMYEYFDHAENLLSHNKVDTIALIDLYNEMGTILIYNLFGNTRIIGNDTITGMDYFKKVCDLRCAYYGENSIQCAEECFNYGNRLFYLEKSSPVGEKKKSWIKYYEQSHDILNSILVVDSNNFIAQFNLCEVEFNLNYDVALFHKSVLSILEKAQLDIAQNDSVIKSILSSIVLGRGFSQEESLRMMVNYFSQHLYTIQDTICMCNDIANALLPAHKDSLLPHFADSCANMALKLMSGDFAKENAFWQKSILERVYRYYKNYDKVLEIYNSELDHLKKIYGENDRKVCEKYVAVADIYLEAGKIEEAIYNYEQACSKGNRTMMFIYQYSIYKANKQLGILYRDKGNYNLSIKHLQAIIEMYERAKSISESNMRVRWYSDYYIRYTQLELGYTYQVMGEIKKAKALYQEAFKFFKEQNNDEMTAKAQIALDSLKKKK